MVVVNPTHYAVALRYAPDEHPLPLVIAKGMDEAAAVIRRAAAEARDALLEAHPARGGRAEPERVRARLAQAREHHPVVLRLLIKVPSLHCRGRPVCILRKEPHAFRP